MIELVFILDESGSMRGLEKDTIGGFNSTIAKQKKEDGECLVSTVCFSNSQRVVHDRVNLRDVKELTEKDYVPCGSTALIDTVASSIKHIKMVHRYIRKEDRPDKVMFIITTDGMENASHKHSLSETKRMIEECKENGWEFIFLAANIDAYETARDYGFDEGSTVNYVNDEEGTNIKFCCVGKAISSIRSSGVLDREWNFEAKEDFNRRGKK